MLARSSGLRGTRNTTTRRKYGYDKKRRTIRRNVAKVKYQRPTARHQRAQIASNTYAINRLRSRVNRHKVYCDYQYGFSGPIGNFGWYIVPLTDFSNWEAVLRQDLDAKASSHTYIQRLQLNLRMVLNTASYCTFNVFLVTLRRNASNRNPVSTTGPDAGGLTAGEDYIEQVNMFAGANCRLNSNIFKVHYAKYKTLTNNAFGVVRETEQTAGDPNTTWAKAQVTMPMKFSVTVPSFSEPGETSWKDKPFLQLPYYQRYYLMVYIGAPSSETGSPILYGDALFTTINTD